MRLSRADKAIYKHSDMEDLERILREKEYNNVLLLLTGIFYGWNLVNLKEIVRLGKSIKHIHMLMMHMVVVSWVKMNWDC